MEDSNLYKVDDDSKPKTKIYKPLAQRIGAKFQEHNELGQKEAHDAASRSEMVRKLFARVTHADQFQQHNDIGYKGEDSDVSKCKVLKEKLLAPTTSTSVFHFQEQGEIEQQEALDVSKLMVPKEKLLASTSSVAQFQARSGNGQPKALKMPKTSQRRQKSGNSIKGFDSTGSPSNCHQEYSEPTNQLSKLDKKYRALRCKYLNLEGKSSILEDELKESESEMKKLEKEKLTLLDKLVVLEGLVNPLDFKSPTQKL